MTLQVFGEHLEADLVKDSQYYETAKFATFRQRLHYGLTFEDVEKCRVSHLMFMENFRSYKRSISKAVELEGPKPTTHYCPMCNETLPIGDFWTRGSGAIYPYCKACSVAYNRKRRGEPRTERQTKKAVSFTGVDWELAFARTIYYSRLVPTNPKPTVIFDEGMTLWEYCVLTGQIEGAVGARGVSWLS